MRRNWTKLLLLAIAVVTSGLVACDMTGSSELVTNPRFEAARANEPSRLVRGAVPEHVATLTIAKRIGPDGGTLEHAGHRLMVPAGAVAETALFKLRLTRSGYVEVDLTATGVGDRSSVNVGSKGFSQPVILQLSYAYAEIVSNPARLAVVWVREDGTIEKLASDVDIASRTVTARLNHFSKYALALE